jgi:hypothetical protein
MPLKIDGEFDWWHLLPMSMDKYQYEEWCSAGKPVTGPARLARDEEKRVRAIVEPVLEERVRAICEPMLRRLCRPELMRAMVQPMVDEAKSELRREFRSLTRRARLRRWSRKDAERFAESYVQNLPKVKDIK